MTVSVDKLHPQEMPHDTHAEAAFERLFQEHWEQVYGVVVRIVGDPAEAEDLALEAFLKLHNAAGIDNPVGWLYRVATNLALNALRSGKRREQYERRAGENRLEAAPPPNPAQEVIRQEQREQVRRVLARMKPRSAKLLILRHSGLSYAQVASALNCSPNSVGMLLDRAEREFERRYRALEGS